MKKLLPISIRQSWGSVRASFWFIPALMVVFSILLGILMIYVDRNVDTRLSERFPTFLAANASGARSILATIAGSMITVAGVTFSITIVALSIASNQYTPRILRNFMSDKGNQVVLGVFVSVFIYCLVVLRWVRGGEESFIPSYSLMVGIFLATVAIGFLIYFVHHISSMVQASTILANIYHETMEAIDELYPEADEERESKSATETAKDFPADHSFIIPSKCTGYVQDVDEHALIEWAEKNGAVLEMVCGIGEFVAAGAPLLKVHSRGEVDRPGALELSGQYSVSRARTTEQDPTFGIRQIVDVALKALSPGINDTTTAVSCLDYLGALIFHLAERDIPPRERCKDSEVRLVACSATYESIVNESFHEIRQHAGPNVAIYVKLLATMERAASSKASREELQVLWQHAQLVTESAGTMIKHSADRAMISEALAKTAARLQQDHRPFTLPGSAESLAASASHGQLVQEN